MAVQSICGLIGGGSSPNRDKKCHGFKFYDCDYLPDTGEQTEHRRSYQRCVSVLNNLDIHYHSIPFVGRIQSLSDRGVRSIQLLRTSPSSCPPSRSIRPRSSKSLVGSMFFSCVHYSYLFCD